MKRILQKLSANKLNSIITNIFLIPVLFMQLSCSDILSVDDKPDSVERQVNYKIIFKDKTDFMQKLFGNDFVCDANVVLKSNMLGTEYNLVTDKNGEINISGIVSDKYLLTASRIMTPDEMMLIAGTAASNVRLVNKTQRIADLVPNKQNQILVEMEPVAGTSPLVISEIYACGPPGSGLYYHDKYVEIYNQSDSVLYLDSMVIAVVYSSSYLGLNYRDDPEFIHSKSIWIFPGNGNDYPIQPGQFILCAEDAIDHRINAANSTDLSHADFEFYKDDAPDVDNPAIPNMIRIYQPAGNDWLIGGEKGAIVLAEYPVDSLKPYSDEFLIPYNAVIDGVEYSDDPTQLDKKILNEGIDAGATGGIQFYTGKSMERNSIIDEGRKILKDENNSSVDFIIIDSPSPGRYFR